MLAHPHDLKIFRKKKFKLKYVEGSLLQPAKLKENRMCGGLF